MFEEQARPESAPDAPCCRPSERQAAARRLGLRWTVGDVSPNGFEALRLSIAGAWRIFGQDAAYGVVVNTIACDDARRRTGPVGAPVRWESAGALPDFIAARLDPGMAQGVAWKFAPLRLFPGRHELSLDNDCILWDMPDAIAAWLADDEPSACVVAADVRPCFGQFAAFCGPAPRNTGIRGTAPGFDLAAALRRMIERHPVMLHSELDEQGLQIAALSQGRAPHVVGVEDVAICSPFPPHRPDLGRCGAHFVGLNVRRVPWSHDGRPGHEWIDRHWRRHRPALHARVGLPLP